MQTESHFQKMQALASFGARITNKLAAAFLSSPITILERKEWAQQDRFALAQAIHSVAIPAPSSQRFNGFLSGRMSGLTSPKDFVYIQIAKDY